MPDKTNEEIVSEMMGELSTETEKISKHIDDLQKEMEETGQEVDKITFYKKHEAEALNFKKTLKEFATDVRDFCEEQRGSINCNMNADPQEDFNMWRDRTFQALAELKVKLKVLKEKGDEVQELCVDLGKKMKTEAARLQKLMKLAEKSKVACGWIAGIAFGIAIVGLCCIPFAGPVFLEVAGAVAIVAGGGGIYAWHYQGEKSEEIRDLNEQISNLDEVEKQLEEVCAEIEAAQKAMGDVNAAVAQIRKVEVTPANANGFKKERDNINKSLDKLSKKIENLEDCASVLRKRAISIEIANE